MVDFRIVGAGDFELHKAVFDATLVVFIVVVVVFVMGLAVLDFLVVGDVDIVGTVEVADGFVDIFVVAVAVLTL